LFSAGLAQVQTARENALFLLKPVHLSGIVMDSNGKPLQHVWINHDSLRERTVETDGEGRFDFVTQAPALVFRKAGFDASYYRVERDATLRLKLGSAQRMLECPESSDCVSLKGFTSAFCLPKLRRIKITKQGNDIDYGQRWFVIHTATGKNGIQHAAGPMWGTGIPFDQDVWSAVEYTETDYQDLDGFLVVDARGKDAKGQCWRVLGHFGETASYRNVSSDDASTLDKVLDGVCLRHSSQ
jgi:hypothetical protein